MRIAIVGASVAGATAARKLAEQGHEVVAFERHTDREKFCGGGLTGKLLREFPEIRALVGPYVDVKSVRVISAYGTVAHLGYDGDFRIFSRINLDSKLRQMAIDAGAEVRDFAVSNIEEHDGRWLVEGEEFDFLIGAGGYNCPVRKLKGRDVPRSQTAPMVGYLVPGDFGNEVTICILSAFDGYIWVFPRHDHASIGLMAPGAEMHATSAFQVLDHFIARYCPEADMSRARRRGAPAPMPMDRNRFADPVAGANWALVGDAAGLCDPITGEGIYYAMTSAKMLAEAIEAQRPESYDAALRDRIWPELFEAARVKHKFFRNWFWEAGVFIMKRSPTCARIAADYVAGNIGYFRLKPLTMEKMSRMIAESLLHPLG